VGAVLGDVAVFEDVDAVGFADGREAVGDDEAGAVAAQAIERFLHESFGAVVERGGGFV